ncbi:hypothetical protein [Kitasatospora arboriphila]|uniref:Uncharacterized protein n=1 Tax=Kitasatospora arboriphila TaxID=258052 RepID=A0ABN1TCY7_9ACTN
MITFKFSRRPAQGSAGGFDLGDIDIIGQISSATSTEKHPDQGMMIFPSVALLLDQLRPAISAGKGVVNFCGVDSSFQARFTVAKGKVSVSGSPGEIGVAPIPEFVDTLISAADEFIETELAGIPGTDPARDDLLAAVADFRELSRKGPRTSHRNR